MPARQLSYNSYSLQTDEVTTAETDIFTPAPRNVQVVKLAQRDGGVYNGGAGDLDPKEFYVAGTLRPTDGTNAGLDDLIDQFLLALSVPMGNFDIEYGTGTRRFVCAPKAPSIARTRGMTHAGFTANFIVPSGVGTDINPSTLLGATSITNAQSSIPINVGGTYKSEPTIRLTYSSITGGTGKTVTISNGTTMRGIQITRNWTSGDVIDINTLEATLYVNSIPVNFNGAFPEWEPGTGAITVMDDFTARTGSLTATYYRRWL